MKCPKCGSENIYVKNTMPHPNGKEIYRSRGCTDCGTAFRTVEKMDDNSRAFQYGYSAAVDERTRRSRKGKS